MRVYINNEKLLNIILQLDEIVSIYGKRVNILIPTIKSLREIYAFQIMEELIKKYELDVIDGYRIICSKKNISLMEMRNFNSMFKKGKISIDPLMLESLEIKFNDYKKHEKSVIEKIRDSLFHFACNLDYVESISIDGNVIEFILQLNGLNYSELFGKDTERTHKNELRDFVNQVNQKYGLNFTLRIKPSGLILW